MSIAGRNFAELNGLVQIVANFRFRSPQSIWQQVLEDGAVSAQRGHMGDTSAHGSGADDRDGLDFRHYYFLSNWVSTSFRLPPAPRRLSERRLRSSASSVGTK